MMRRLPMIFVGHRAFDGASVASVMPIDRILCCDSAKTAELLRSEASLKVFVLEEQSNVRERWTNNHIDTILDSAKEELKAYGGAATLLPYASTQVIERLVCDRTIRQAYAVSSRLRRFLDDKGNAMELFAALGLPVIDGTKSQMSVEHILSAAASLRYPIVVRAPVGSTGSATYRADSNEDAAGLACQLQNANGNTLWLVERFVTGPSLSVSAVVTESQVLIFSPSVQLIGIPECTDFAFGFCGSDYIAATELGSQVHSECYRQIKLIGHSIARLGYRGLLGVDFIIDPTGIVYPCEINPRFQNSTALLNFMLSQQAELSPARIHVASFDPGAAHYDGDLVQANFGLSQIVAYLGKDQEGAAAGGFLQEGQYTISEKGDMTFDKASCDPRELSMGQCLVTEAVSRAGMQIRSGAPLFKIISRRQVINAREGNVAQWAIHAIAALRRLLDIRSDSDE